MNKIFLKKFKSPIKYGLIIALLCLMPSVTKAQYTINSVHGNLAECDTMTRGIFIIWWDKDFNYAAQADVMLDSMISIRSTCLNKLNMQDPKSALDGYYCNIYIFTGGSTIDYFTVNFPAWGNGVGGDVNGYAFMTTPHGTLGDWRNLAHETFHIFQSHGMWDITTGIYNTNDGGWYVEAMANWFAASRYQNDANSFVETEILVSLPHVPLWMGWINFPSYYQNNWQRQVHQYALAAYFYYLTSKAGVADTLLTNVFYSGTTLTPQQYLFNTMGASKMRKDFIDCAAHLSNNFDFLTPTQGANAKTEWNTYAAPLDRNKFIKTYNNTGSNGWFTPVDSIVTNAWSFNTYKLLNNTNQAYTFDINGNATGDYGGAAFFQGKILVQNSVTGASFHDVVMTNSTQGSLTLNLQSTDTAVHFIIANMPEIFTDPNPTFQLFPYQMRISKSFPASVTNTVLPTQKIEVARYNMLGQKITVADKGLQIIQYNDGSARKVFIY